MQHHLAQLMSKRPTMNDVWPDKCGVYILDNESTATRFIDKKIKELDSMDSEEPFQVLNLDTLIQMHLKWLSYLPRVKPFYAVKCNSTETVLRTLNALGTGFDCASKGEISQVLSLGVKPENIIYAHTTKPQSHIKYACAQGVNLMTFDDEEELQKVSRCHPKAKLVLRIAVDDSSSFYRLSSKFGAGLSTTGRLLECAAELGLEVVGVSFHIGSKCSQSLAFRQAIADARSVFDTAKLLGFQFSLLDIGGGFSGKDFPVTLQEFSEVINGALDEYFPFESGVQVIAEPGRYYAESTFTLAANVIAKRVIMEDMRTEGEKESPEKLMMYYLSDGVFGSLNSVLKFTDKNEVTPYLHRAVDNDEKRYRSVIWGPTCHNIDKIVDNYLITELHVGDWLLIDNIGAYGISISTEFNGFKRSSIYSVVTNETWHTLNLSSQ
ncbi:ornithine decarboxylase-like [Takifugu rubripes]|uniref:ornithine decarboxylase-like n=1 Tax=Takifugu rubripes TaxID=31033 RepID=UPI0011458A3B|nr:ornithine decarboxylase-like [Takifugu rubripes]XP_029692824.1 ornithine decarboxylase-like [Takifugu rubripes]